QAEALLLEAGEQTLGFVDVLLDGRTRAAVILVGEIRRGGDGIDGIRADQRVDVERVAVLRVLRAGRRPERALHLRAFFTKALETLAAEDFLELPIGKLRVRDRDLAEERLERRIVLPLRFDLL